MFTAAVSMNPGLVSELSDMRLSVSPVRSPQNRAMPAIRPLVAADGNDLRLG